MPKASSSRSKPVAASQPGTPQDPSAAPPKRMSPAEAAQYISEFSAELASLAREANLDLLAYMLDMARLEATEAARSP